MAFLIGFIIGFLMCIPIGPINIWVINTYLKKGFPHSFSIALGGSLMDFTYFFFIMTGLSFMTFSQGFEQNCQRLGIVLIVLLGAAEILRKRDDVDPQTADNSAHKLIGSIALGIMLYVSNPTLILTMTGLGAFVKSLGYFASNLSNSFLVSAGLAAGSAVWFLLLLGLVKRYEEAVKTKFSGSFNKASGVLMILCGALMSVRIYAKA